MGIKIVHDHKKSIQNIIYVLQKIVLKFELENVHVEKIQKSNRKILTFCCL